MDWNTDPPDIVGDRAIAPRQPDTIERTAITRE